MDAGRWVRTASMGARPVRVLFVSDSHVGYDVSSSMAHADEASRAGDFVCNHRAALARALEGDIDLVVHGGDLLHRSHVPAAFAEAAYQPLVEVARAGVPVFVVPASHERARLLAELQPRHPALHVFDEPGAWSLEVAGQRVVVGGFASVREVGAGGLRRRVAESGLLQAAGPAVRLLCLHQPVEGALLAGTHRYLGGRELVPASEIPSAIAAVLCGDVHRHQVLESTPDDTPLGAPVICAGSLERISGLERHDAAKGYVVASLVADAHGGRLLEAQFEPVPTRPMFRIELDASRWSAPSLQARLEELFWGLDARAIVELAVTNVAPSCAPLLGAESVRALHPPSMRVRVVHGGAGELEALCAPESARNDDGLVERASRRSRRTGPLLRHLSGS